MDILEYVKNVKDFSLNEINTIIGTVEASASTLEDNLRMMKSSKVELSPNASQWFVPASILKSLASNGFRHNSIEEPVLFAVGVVKTVTTGLTKAVKDIGQNVWSGKVITMKQAMILNLLEHLQFWNRYSELLISTMLSATNEDKQPGELLSGFDNKWLNGTKGFYETFTVTLMKGSRAMLERINDAPDLPVDENTIELLEAAGDKNVTDVTQQNFGIHLITPVFWVSLAKSKIQLRRIENMRARNAQFSMKISQAINKKGGNPDPKLDRQIEIYQAEIAKNEAAIEAIEESYA